MNIYKNSRSIITKLLNQKSRPGFTPSTSLRGFTIVELIVVIVIIGILSSVSIVSYGNWQQSVVAAQLKSDLNGVATAMESYRNFNSGYPITVPSTFNPSPDVTLTGGSSDGIVYCVDALSSKSSSIHYYIDQSLGNKGAQSGTCASRPIIPATPVNLVATAVSSSTINLSWSAVVGATSYNVQQSSDSSFTNVSTVAMPTGTSASASSLTTVTTYYYRVSAVNSTGQSGWSIAANAITLPGCNNPNQYGTYPNCYAYDSLPVGTSISGYFGSIPNGYLAEDGSAVSRTTYANLFAVIGTTYGVGDGSTTFNLPDSRGRVTVNKNPSDTEFDTMGKKYGEKTHLLTVAEMPSHSHGMSQNYGYAAGGTPATNGFSGTASYMVGYSGGGQTHNVIQPSIVKLFAIKYLTPPVSTSYTLSSGTSIDGYWSSAPSGYLAEDGSAVSRITYSDLFAVIGTTYGVGDGSTTFNLPDSRGRVAANKNPGDTEFDTIGKKYGEKTHLLTIAEMPSHSHGISQNYGYAAGGTSATSGFGGTASYMVGYSGGGQTHNVIQPSIVKLSVIKYTAKIASEAINIITPGASMVGYWSSAPAGYLTEDGSAVSRTTYANLFAVIGTTYGVGDGSTTFNLPDSRGRVAVNKNPSDTEFDTIGKKYGEKTHLLTIAEMPSHSHGISQNYGYAAGGTSATHGFGGTASYLTGGSGGSQAHNVIQPSIVKMFVIQY